MEGGASTAACSVFQNSSLLAKQKEGMDDPLLSLQCLQFPRRESMWRVLWENCTVDKMTVSPGDGLVTREV